MRTASSPQRFKFGGKEKDDVTRWTDFGARMYMDDIGRWGVVDKVSMAMPRWSPYSYSFNNPIRYNDPDGNIPYDQTVSSLIRIGHYGMRKHPITGEQKMHRGTDLTAKQGTSINSFASGTVVVTGKSSSWGNYVVVDHGQGYYSLYAHVEDDGILVKEGQKVGDGENIARVGTTGRSTGPHLHLEVGKAKDVWEFLGKENRDKTRTNAAEIGDLEKFLHGDKTANNNSTGGENSESEGEESSEKRKISRSEIKWSKGKDKFTKKEKNEIVDYINSLLQNE